MKLSGIEWPWNGKPIYQTDFLFEHSSFASELINRFTDIFSGNVFVGGAVTPGTTPGSVNISSLIGYDGEGRRIQFSNINNLQISRPEADSVVVARHRFQETSSGNFDSTGYAINYRNNSFEILFLGSAEPNDILLAEIRNISGTVTILSDLRNWRRMNADKLSPNSIFNGLLAPNIKIGSLDDLIASFVGGARISITNALNVLMAKLETEVESLTSSITAINQFITNNLPNLYAPKMHTHPTSQSAFVIDEWVDSTNFTHIPDVDGTIVLYKISAGISFGNTYSIHGHVIGGIPPVGGSLSGIAVKSGGVWRSQVI
ncbi:hypothetical protein EHQ16_03315 [Leptospira kanakyensis]|uniref:Uncharacterized protein n=1 Tax=Leptospira kanakyensis TaxID=2484968 RepID=A0A6N4Q5X3_9LEPT|nr:hypothetical protein [Leptospira kanakyensis]TGK47501.1 hypothetical protein EHQ11_16315 [Leptospira kanakyensis]TGK63496.1 hypothetical protein EHQ16_03315 [Leptospira kanakyensis]TGK67100.1 hypothetical protein EHQ18_18555 [Leptospira kanakyensis]